MSRRSIILTNLGTTTEPEPEAVREFLTEFLSDRYVVDYPAWFWQPVLKTMVLRKRPERVAELYRTIWTDEGSPLEVGTRRITDAVAEILGDRADVCYAYRYGKPSIAARIDEGLERGVDSFTVVPLFPQRTGSTTTTVETLAAHIAAERGISERVRVVVPAPDLPGYIAGTVEVWKDSIAGAGFEPEHLVVSFHGIPKRYDRGERGLYQQDCQATHSALLTEMGWPAERATLAYQSKFGPEPWIGPATADLLEALPGRGIKSVAVATPGFITEGLETIEEIGIRGEESFMNAGGKEYLRLPCVQENRRFVESLADFVMSGHDTSVTQS